MFRAMAVDSSVVFLSCFIFSGALGSPSLLPSRSITTITISLHIIIMHLYISTSTIFIRYNVDNAAIDSIAPFLVKRGYAACEVEYRRGSEGGWPISNEDCLAALASLKNNADLFGVIDFNSVTLLGHSAGGQLVLWICAQKSQSLSSLGFSPRLCVALSPCADLGKSISNIRVCLFVYTVDFLCNVECCITSSSGVLQSYYIVSLA